MILHDTCILSTLARVDRLSLLFDLFPGQQLCLSGNVEAELRRGASGRHPALQRALDLIGLPPGAPGLEVLRPGPREVRLYSRIPFHPHHPDRHLKGEVDTVALAWTHRATLLCKERRVFTFCQTNTYRPIPCLLLEDLLRNLWQLGILSKAEVEALVDEIEARDRARINRGAVI
jgi:hypothetical protein